MALPRRISLSLHASAHVALGRPTREGRDAGAARPRTYTVPKDGRAIEDQQQVNARHDADRAIKKTNNKSARNCCATLARVAVARVHAGPRRARRPPPLAPWYDVLAQLGLDVAPMIVEATCGRLSPPVPGAADRDRRTPAAASAVRTGQRRRGPSDATRQCMKPGLGREKGRAPAGANAVRVMAQWRTGCPSRGASDVGAGRTCPSATSRADRTCRAFRDAAPAASRRTAACASRSYSRRPRRAWRWRSTTAHRHHFLSAHWL